MISPEYLSALETLLKHEVNPELRVILRRRYLELTDKDNVK
jgi:hypothetical protein